MKTASSADPSSKPGPAPPGLPRDARFDDAVPVRYRPDAIPPSAMRRSSNRNTDPRKRAASAAINRTLDEFFAPHNEALYRWTASQGIPWTRWT